jgi:hypothetical protein
MAAGRHPAPTLALVERTDPPESGAHPTSDPTGAS